MRDANGEWRHEWLRFHETSTARHSLLSIKTGNKDVMPDLWIPMTCCYINHIIITKSADHLAIILFCTNKAHINKTHLPALFPSTSVQPIKILNCLTIYLNIYFFLRSENVSFKTIWGYTGRKLCFALQFFSYGTFLRSGLNQQSKRWPLQNQVTCSKCLVMWNISVSNMSEISECKKFEVCLWTWLSTTLISTTWH